MVADAIKVCLIAGMLALLGVILNLLLPRYETTIAVPFIISIFVEILIVILWPKEAIVEKSNKTKILSVVAIIFGLVFVLSVVYLPPYTPCPTCPSINMTPILKDLKSNIHDPASAIRGYSVLWTAEASDPEGDQISYNFSLRGPFYLSGGEGSNKWITKKPWSNENFWNWDTSGMPSGTYIIRVCIKDGKHASENGFDDYKTELFRIL